jgi:signal transduction histidine kinase
VTVNVFTAPLPPEVEATAYFVCAEALTNVARHSGASSAALAIDVHGDELWVQISDDGIGSADSRRGSGLVGLADRIEAVGGRLDLRSQIHSGTTVMAWIPLTGVLPLQPKEADQRAP